MSGRVSSIQLSVRISSFLLSVGGITLTVVSECIILLVVIGGIIPPVVSEDITLPVVIQDIILLVVSGISPSQLSMRGIILPVVREGIIHPVVSEGIIVLVVSGGPHPPSSQCFGTYMVYMIYPLLTLNSQFLK